MDRLRATFADDFFARIGDHGFAAMSVVRDGACWACFILTTARLAKPVDDLVYQQFKAAVSRLCA